MRIYPVNLYVSRRGLVASAVVSAIGAAVVFGVVPGVEALRRDCIRESAKMSSVVDAMPTPWGELYRMLAAVNQGDRGATFMEFATGSREMKPGKRSPVRRGMPALSPDGVALFTKLFDSWDATYVAPVLMTMSCG